MHASFNFASMFIHSKSVIDNHIRCALGSRRFGFVRHSTKKNKMRKCTHRERKRRRGNTMNVTSRAVGVDGIHEGNISRQ